MQILHRTQPSLEFAPAPADQGQAAEKHDSGSHHQARGYWLGRRSSDHLIADPDGDAEGHDSKPQRYERLPVPGGITR